MLYLHLHCSAVIAHRITAADVRGKNGFSQDGFDPLICPWGMAQMLGLGLHFHHLIHGLGVCCMTVWRQRKSVCALVSCFGWLGHKYVRLKAAIDAEPLLKTTNIWRRGSKSDLATLSPVTTITSLQCLLIVNSYKTDVLREKKKMWKVKIVGSSKSFAAYFILSMSASLVFNYFFTLWKVGEY